MYPTFVVALWFVAGVCFISGLYHTIYDLEFYVSLLVGASFAWLAVVVKRRHDKAERWKREREMYMEYAEKRIEATGVLEPDWKQKAREEWEERKLEGAREAVRREMERQIEDKKFQARVEEALARNESFQEIRRELREGMEKESSKKEGDRGS